MRNRTRERKVHLYSRPAKWLLSLLAFFILVANTLILNETNKLADLYSSQKNQATWFLFHLAKEYRELMFEARNLRDGHGTIDAVNLHYDLTWSRFDTMLSSRESDDFMSVTQEKAQLEAKFDRFKELEPKLQNLSENDQNSIDVFYIATERLHQEVSDYINQIFRVSNPLLLEKQQQANTLNVLQMVLLSLFIICLLLIWFIYYQELKHSRSLAMTDSLTNLSNRFALFENTNRLTAENQRFVLFLLDLNGFKEVNDVHGHIAGDEVLIEVASRLQSLTNYDCAPYRLGGDEFAIILNITDADCTSLFKQELMYLFEEAFNYNNNKLKVTTSIGMATYPDETLNIDELLMLADQKMYLMKTTF
ncbi:GGDEF domain-containing protein [Vibrio hannami]|uniref:GGDEF domain-containing protein n=1 Tax=Vibrio hannami TaxID=2717094 RepID=UPI00240FB628|nr:GGDEF domain-containing protein [Vibrio hannami]MDG3084989.1 GGDEF domain-containing protein [Vibrio hannami]